jgi:peptide/nickel transport system permease protein
MQKGPLFSIMIGRLRIRRRRGRSTFISGLVLLSVVLVLTIGAPLLSNLPPSGETRSGGFFTPYEPPSSEHLMGTNNIGQDIFTRVIYGGVPPLEVALFATSLAGSIGISTGLWAGYLGGKFEKVVSVCMDSIYAFPGIILAIAITAALGANIFNTTFALGAIYVPSFYRMTRGQTLQLKQVPFVEAARSIGETNISILTRYILPSIMPAIAVIASLSFADAILLEAGLSFIGLPSVAPPTPDWGYDIVIGKDNLLSGSWWMIVFPGLMIIIAVLGFSLVGEGLNDLYSAQVKQTK